MKCDICDREFANSEEVKRHQEREHPRDGGGDDGLEQPDLLDGERPDPVVRPTR